MGGVGGCPPAARCARAALKGGVFAGACRGHRLQQQQHDEAAPCGPLRTALCE
ncbi:hypothetical protein BU14_2781s0001 [Porphyra umbilicalis]|uniref:Uncharacterized protein n=1 Tax=Porphyra umbilicalis TaxID=2786 RepID=A0A1X6NIT1_PORUM|nr:hypothetical protein BU14_2781s0001 [Porphyra umbilicalis]|eukprot:OSX68450.1 hypothetical protein BU14_2781s0001 [Porphyra umbilicalis]